MDTSVRGELEAAIERGDVTETHQLDFKGFTHEGGEEAVRVPTATVAKTVCGLAVDGGVVVLGVAEPERRRFVCEPRRLTGLRDSVDRVVGSSITTDPDYRMLDDERSVRREDRRLATTS